MEYTNDQGIQKEYESMSADRDAFLSRARACAEITIPTLMPQEGHTGSSVYNTPFQSVCSW